MLSKKSLTFLFLALSRQIRNWRSNQKGKQLLELANSYFLINKLMASIFIWFFQNFIILSLMSYQVVVLMYKSISLVYNKMISATKALQANLKNLTQNIALLNVVSSNFGTSTPSMNQKSIPSTQGIEQKISSLTQNNSFSVAQAKATIEKEDILRNSPELKKIQKSGAHMFCFNPANHQEQDVPIRIMRTHKTITFLPSVEFLSLQYSSSDNFAKVYHRQDDNVLNLHKLSCKNCGHESLRPIPENGYRFGTVVTGCEECQQLVLLSDHLGWVEPRADKCNQDIIYSMKQVIYLVKSNLQKAGFDTELGQGFSKNAKLQALE